MSPFHSGLLVVLGTAASSYGQDLNAADLFRLASPSVVTLHLYPESGRDAVGNGSGFFVDHDLIATNWHVAALGVRGVATTAQGEKRWIKSVVAFDKLTDICLMRLRPVGWDEVDEVIDEVQHPPPLTRPHTNVPIDTDHASPFPPARNSPASAPASTVATTGSTRADGVNSFLRFADRLPSPGERIVIIGSPLGLQNTISEGIVSGIRTNDTGSSVIQLTAAISPGSSGSPVLDKHGNVVGIAVSYIASGQNINFAVPGFAVRTINRDRELRFRSWGWTQVTESEASDAATYFAQAVQTVLRFMPEQMEAANGRSGRFEFLPYMERQRASIVRQSPSFLNAAAREVTIEQSGWVTARYLLDDADRTKVHQWLTMATDTNPLRAEYVAALLDFEHEFSPGGTLGNARRIRLLSHLMGLRPLDSVVQFFLANELSSLPEQADRAQQLLTNVAESNPTWRLLQRWHVSFARSTAWSDMATAIRSIERAKELGNDDTSRAWIDYEWGGILLSVGQPKLAIAPSHDAVTKLPQSSLFRLQLGRCYIAGGYPDLARQQLNEIRILANSVNARNDETLESLDRVRRERAAEHASVLLLLLESPQSP